MTDAAAVEKENKTPVGWRDVVRFAAHYWRPNRALGLTAALFMLLSVLMDVILPVFTGRMIDAITMANAEGAAANEGARAAWAAFGAFVVLGLMHHLLRCLSLWVWNKFAVRNLSAIVVDGLRKVQRFSADWHANTFAGGTVRKITRGMWSFDSFEDTLLMGLLPAITVMIGVTVMLTLSLPQVGIAAGVMIFFYCAINIWMSVRILAPRFRESAESDTKVGASLADIITGNPTVKSFAAEGREDQAFSGVVDVWKVKSLRAWQTGVMVDVARSVLRNVMTWVMVGISLWLWHQGRASAGDIVLVITTLFIIGGYLRDIGHHISQLQRAVNDMEDNIGFWLRRDDVVDQPQAKALALPPAGRPDEDFIRFHDVSFAYPGTERLIYDRINVSIRRGEKLALVGPSGSGKSTFVKLLQRLYNVNGGHIAIAGQDIAAVTMESLRQNVALVPQDPILFHRSLSDNIAYGHVAAHQDDIERAAQKAYAHDFIAKLPLGYGTLVGERGVKLSGGERQRVAIARAILADTPVLILDEATSSLDSVSEHYIQQALEKLMEGRTTITIAHRLSTIQRADRILVFDGGRIIEQGSHAELMANPQSRYRQLYEMQALDLVGQA
jgi:ATP-binding cassette subfamily B protein